MWITTSDCLAPPERLELIVTVNGAVVQRAIGGEMIFSVADQTPHDAQTPASF